ncbi:MAG: Uma2 family endonuclease [Myxococcaceae bacterium]
MRQPPIKKPATSADLQALPDSVLGQIVDGELYASPRPASDHALATSSLGDELVGPFQKGRGGPGGWWILDEPELHLRANVLVPDLAGWRVSRMPSLPRVPHFALAPDWVCEVFSPSTAGFDRVTKRHAYAREGVEWLWYIDPIARTLEALQLRDGTWVDAGTWQGHERARVPPFDALELELRALWIDDATLP